MKRTCLFALCFLTIVCDVFARGGGRGGGGGHGGRGGGRAGMHRGGGRAGHQAGRHRGDHFGRHASWQRSHAGWGRGRWGRRWYNGGWWGPGFSAYPWYWTYGIGLGLGLPTLAAAGQWNDVRVRLNDEIDKLEGQLAQERSQGRVDQERIAELEGQVNELEGYIEDVSRYSTTPVRN